MDARHSCRAHGGRCAAACTSQRRRCSLTGGRKPSQAVSNRFQLFYTPPPRQAERSPATSTRDALPSKIGRKARKHTKTHELIDQGYTDNTVFL